MISRTYLKNPRRNIHNLKRLVPSIYLGIFYLNSVDLMCFPFQACEEAIAKLKNSLTSPQTSIYYVINQIIYPLSQGCETKDVKLIKVSSFKFNIKPYLLGINTLSLDKDWFMKIKEMALILTFLEVPPY